MEKEFVAYELAVKLKELGFDDGCFGYYEPNKNLNYIEKHILKDFPYLAKNSEWQDLCAAPTYSQSFRWFREKNIYATINTYHSVNEDKPFGLSIDYLHESGKWDYFDYSGESDFETYEEAELACLEKLIELVESK